MKINFTNTENRVNVFAMLFGLIILFTILTLQGCSSSSDQLVLNNQNFVDKSFIFHDEGSIWKVEFKDNKISSLYRDNKRIPDNELDDYRDKINKNLRELRNGLQGDETKIYHKFFDDKNTDKDIEIFKDKDKLHFKLKLDENEFEKNMQKLKESLKDLKSQKFKLYFDSDSLNQSLKKLLEELKGLPPLPNDSVFDIDVYMNLDDFKEGMKMFKDSFKFFHFNSDSIDCEMKKEIRGNIKELKNKMKGLKVEIKGKNGELKKLNSFLDELKKEFAKDGYIKSIDDEIFLEMDKDQTIINKKTARKEDHKKYYELFKRYFDKEIDGTIKIEKD